ncbi:hypothetical protein PINS_up004924 [Pythium insidiosum]|nr:hypothetical protein PINS_up004924 [Pythium insidiosum]
MPRETIHATEVDELRAYVAQYEVQHERVKSLMRLQETAELQLRIENEGLKRKLDKTERDLSEERVKRQRYEDEADDKRRKIAEL